MYVAIEQHPDFELHEIRVLTVPTAADVFVVTCTCDGIPNRNRVGLKYQEPLALIVSPDPQLVPSVRALRRDFPLTAHQNNILDGEAASLCLYEQRPLTILRKWTAAAFLQQIQHWLTDTANGRLHQADQPVEQLFFDSPHEVVLPAGFLASVPASAPTLELMGYITRKAVNDPKQRNLTLFLGPVAAGRQPEKSIRFVSVTLAPITHGVVEREPLTLGGLDDQLRTRGTTVMEPLLKHIRTLVGIGCPAADHYETTLLLLITPIQRLAGGTIERVQARAFWIGADVLKIGEDSGVIFRSKDSPPRYYLDHALGSSERPSAWRAHQLMPLSVQERPDLEAARRMSGTVDAGPRAVLAGVGSLGSTMLALWRRAGWGSWHVIDPDYLKPHNIVRHTSRAIGVTKAEAVALEDADLWHDERQLIQAIFGDAGNVDDPAVRAALEQAELIIDATTQLEVPRRLAGINVCRVASCFLNPAGTDSVLIAESATRRDRIDALEAQYYRAVLTEPWGEAHLARAGARFRSGAGCRDVSVVMPYSRISVHAATLAEQIQQLPADARIRIWRQDQNTGAIQVHDLLVHESQIEPIAECELSIVWDRGTLEKVRALRTGAFPAETGGVLIGYHDFNERRVYIVDALAAPPDSVGTPESFKRGVQGLTAQLAMIQTRSAGQVGYIGEWHSHPPGHTALESGADVWQLLYLGAQLKRDGLPALMLIVGEQDEQWLMAR